MRKTTKVVAIGLGLTMILTGCAPASPDGSGSTEAVSLTWMTRPDNQAEADVYASISDDITAKGIGLDLT
jgi:ABC-type glycerol-3-phosphate transport system substrate-binding protein